MRQAVIVSAVRTPMGKFSGALKGLKAAKLGSKTIEALLEGTEVPGEDVDEVIMGNVVSAGQGQNVARQAALDADLPPTVAALHVDKVCGSSLKAVILAAQAIKCGDMDMIIAGGMESMSNCPYLLPKARYGYRMFDGKVVDSMVHDGLWDVYNDYHMGLTGEVVAEKCSLTREEVDLFSYESHIKAHTATEKGHFRDEVVPVAVRDRKKGEMTVESDEGIRPDTTVEKLAALKPFFKEDGLVTAGNSSQLTDGASAVMVTSRNMAEEKGLEILGSIESYNTVGVKPEDVMYSVVPGMRKLLNDTGMTMDDIDLVEHNEAFASASVALKKELDIPDEKFNVHGGAVALGHPIGASGARILTTLLHSMKRYRKHRGAATICLGGGNAVSMMVERE